MWPDQSAATVRDAVAEAQTLRQELDDANADLARMAAELADALEATERWRTRTLELEKTFAVYAANANEARAYLRKRAVAAEAKLGVAEAELESAQRDEARGPRRSEHDRPCLHDNPAPTWQGGRCVKPRGHEVHWNGLGDVWQPDIEPMADELEALRTAARHVVDCYRHGNLMGTVVGVDRLGQVLDGET